MLQSLQFAFQHNIVVHWVKPHSVRLRSSFLTNFALSLYSPWHKLRRYKPASADNAPDRNAPSIPNKQDAQPWGEQEPQLVCSEQTADQGGGTVRPAFSLSLLLKQRCSWLSILYLPWVLPQNGTTVFHTNISIYILITAVIFGVKIYLCISLI